MGRTPDRRPQSEHRTNRVCRPGRSPDGRRKQLRRPRDTLETSLREDLGADSLDLVELVMGLEVEFLLEIPEREAERIRTVGEAVRTVQTHL